MSNVKRTDEIQGEILHVYDGIEEADNSLPTWWLLTFYGAIAFGLAYWFYYQVYGAGQSQRQIYDEALAATEAEKRVVSNESLNALALDASVVGAGSETFATQCIACHGAQAQGVKALGPNLTDAYWIHGGAPTDIHKTVTEGIDGKGMAAWEPILGEEGVNQVVAYVLTLRNTNVPGEAPRGEIWPPEPGDEAAEADTTAGGAGANTGAGGAGGPGEAL